MFEDSTFESMGKIHTRSRGWMIATFAFNGSILIALIVIPLIYPAALPQITNAIPMTAPLPVQEPKPVVRPEHAPAAQTQMPAGVLQAPRLIPDKPWIPSTQEPPMNINAAALGDSSANPAGPGGLFPGHLRIPTCVRRRLRQLEFQKV
jgi:periplasmic protein TonB